MKVYIAGPMTHGAMDENLREAVRVADLVFSYGHQPFLPQLCCFWSCMSAAPKRYEEWMAYDKAWLLACDAILRLPGKSDGADREMADAGAASLILFDSVAQFLAWEQGRTRREALLDAAAAGDLCGWDGGKL